MTDLGVQDAAAKADHMVNPASLAASMIDERAPDIVEALNDTPPELAVAVLLHLPPDRAIEVLDQPGLEREPELVTLMPREAAARLLAGVSADRVADIFHSTSSRPGSGSVEKRRLSDSTKPRFIGFGPSGFGFSMSFMKSEISSNSKRFMCE